MRSLLITAVTVAATMGSVAQADDVIIPDDEEAYVVEAPDDDLLPPDEPEYAPPVYGWTAFRPVNCGEFRYWNGDYCADARSEPPLD